MQDEIPEELIEAEQAEITKALEQLREYTVDEADVEAAEAGELQGGDLPGLSEEELSIGEEVILPKASDRLPLPPPPYNSK